MGGQNWHRTKDSRVDAAATFFGTLGQLHLTKAAQMLTSRISVHKNFSARLFDNFTDFSKS